MPNKRRLSAVEPVPNVHLSRTDAKGERASAHAMLQRIIIKMRTNNTFALFGENLSLCDFLQFKIKNGLIKNSIILHAFLEF